MYSSNLSSIEEAIEDIKNGKIVIVVDDEDRENEGDFIASAEKVTPEMVNFMTKNGRGVLCVPITEKRCIELDLPLMVENNTVLHHTPFTVSVDLKGQGCTTGISVFDRAKTIKSFVDENTKPEDLGRPGHIFPLRAREGGVLRRTGHTEAAVDLTRLAGLKPAGILIEILNEDGTMARLPQLVEVAKKFGLKIISIEDLVKYRLKKDRLVVKKEDFMINTEYGDFRLRAYEQINNGQIHLAFTKGEWREGEAVMTRVHSTLLSNDILDIVDTSRRNELERIFKAVSKEEKAAIVLINHEDYSQNLLNRIGQLKEKQSGVKQNKVEVKDIGIGAQILCDLDITKLILMTNNEQSKYVGMQGYGIDVIDYVNY